MLRPMADSKEFRLAGTPVKGRCRGRTGLYASVPVGDAQIIVFPSIVKTLIGYPVDQWCNYDIGQRIHVSQQPGAIN